MIKRKMIPKAGGALQKLVTSATDAFVDTIVSSLAGSAIDEGAKRVNDLTSFGHPTCIRHSSVDADNLPDWGTTAHSWESNYVLCE